MAIWQYDVYAIPRAALLSAFGRVPPTLSSDDEERLDPWREIDQEALTAKLDGLLVLQRYKGSTKEAAAIKIPVG